MCVSLTALFMSAIVSLPSACPSWDVFSFSRALMYEQIVSVEFTCVNLYYNLSRQCYGSNKGSECQSAGCEHILNYFEFIYVSNEKKGYFSL